jgi:hypothetical protein
MGPITNSSGTYVGLVGCASQKLQRRAPACELPPQLRVRRPDRSAKASRAASMSGGRQKLVHADDDAGFIKGI